MAEAAELDEVTLTFGQAMTNPATAFHVNYEEVLKRRAELRGVPDYTRFFDFALARQVAALMMQMQQAPPPPQKTQAPQNRLLQDLSGARPGVGSGGGGPGLNSERKSMGPAKMLNGSKPKAEAMEA